MSFTEDPDFVMNMDFYLDSQSGALLDNTDFLIGFDPLLNSDPLEGPDAPEPAENAQAIADAATMFPGIDFTSHDTQPFDESSWAQHVLAAPADDTTQFPDFGIDLPNFDTQMFDDTDSINGKQEIEYFACGHAKSSSEWTYDDTHMWSSFDLLPSEANYTFTNNGCGHGTCTRSKPEGATADSGSTVLHEQYIIIEPSDLKSKYEQYCRDITDIGNRLVSIHSDCLLAAWACDVPFLRHLFDMFPTCFVGDATPRDNGDIQTLLTRIYEDSNSEFAEQIMCRLASRKLASLVGDLRFYRYYLTRLTKLQDDMWHGGCLSIYAAATAEETPLHMTVRNEMASAEFGPDGADEGTSVAYPYWDRIDIHGAWTHELPPFEYSPLRPYDIGGSHYKLSYETVRARQAKEEVSPITPALRTLRDMVEAGVTSFGPDVPVHHAEQAKAQVVEQDEGYLIWPTMAQRNVLKTSDGTIAKRRMHERWEREYHLDWSSTSSVTAAAPQRGVQGTRKRGAEELSEDAPAKRQRKE